MTRLWCLLIAIAILSAVPFSTFDTRAERFNEAWNKFYRRYLGCPPDAVFAVECRPQLGVLDRKEYDKARAAAIKLFDLN